jgi:hypothetical protein
MIGSLIEILGERGIFTEEEYKRLKDSMTSKSDVKDTLDVLEDIVEKLKRKKMK